MVPVKLEAGSVLGFVSSKHRMDVGGYNGVVWGCWSIPTQRLPLSFVVDAGPPAKVKGKKREGRSLRKSTEHVTSCFGRRGEGSDLEKEGGLPCIFKVPGKPESWKVLYAINPHGPGLPQKRLQRKFDLIVALSQPFTICV